MQRGENRDWRVAKADPVKNNTNVLKKNISDIPFLLTIFNYDTCAHVLVHAGVCVYVYAHIISRIN